MVKGGEKHATTTAPLFEKLKGPSGTVSSTSSHPAGATTGDTIGTADRTSARRKRSPSQKRKSPRKSGRYQPTVSRKIPDPQVPGPGAYNLPPLNIGRGPTFPVMHESGATSGRRKGSSSAQDSDDDQWDEPGTGGRSPSREAGAGQHHHHRPSGTLGPGAYELQGSFDTPSVTWTPRHQINGTPRRQNIVMNVDLYQASRIPGPGSYTPRTGFTGRDRTQRNRLPIERYNPGLMAVNLPAAAKASRY